MFVSQGNGGEPPDFVSTLHLGVFRYASSLSTRCREGAMIDFKGSYFEKEITLWGYGGTWSIPFRAVNSRR
jgi:hypothetical protein